MFPSGDLKPFDTVGRDVNFQGGMGGGCMGRRVAGTDRSRSTLPASTRQDSGGHKGVDFFYLRSGLNLRP